MKNHHFTISFTADHYQWDKGQHTLVLTLYLFRAFTLHCHLYGRRVKIHPLPFSWMFSRAR